MLKNWLLIAFGVVLAAHVIPGIEYDDGGALAGAVVLLSLFNLILKPLLILFTLPFIMITCGLGLLFINAALFLLVGSMVEGFEVHSFWSALGASVIVSLTTMGLNALLRSHRLKENTVVIGSARKGKNGREDDVIDI